MCGIAGYVVLDGGKCPSPDTLPRMNDMLAHRGPDDSGCYLGNGFGLAMRRLSIIDVERGRQPVFSPDGQTIVVFNGEIYNHEELKRRLRKRGHTFHTRSDTEVLPALYLEHGTEMVNHLQGMFAIAIWGFRERKLTLLRDRFGQKPLYTAVHSGAFYFASEIKALLAAPGFPREIDLDAMRQYLFLGQIHAPRTPIKHVHSLPPAHVQEITPLRVASPIQYWDICTIPRANANRDKDATLEELDARMAQAVKARLQSDVPLAATLSGGLDSSTVLYYAAETSNAPTDAFCITFQDEEAEEEGLNESDYQNEVARRLGVETHRLDFYDREQEIADSMSRAYWIYEYPNSVVQQEVVFSLLADEMYRNGFKVGLGGEGADEMMRGYEWYGGENSFLSHLGQTEGARSNGSPRSVHYVKEENWFVQQWGYPSILFQNYMEWSRIRRVFRKGLLPPAFTDEVVSGPDHVDFGSHIPKERFRDYSGPELIQYADIRLRLPGFILNVQDKFSMASSVEMRSPFLDHTLAEWLVSLPPNLHRSRGSEKHLLKTLMAGRLPRSVTRRQKQGYTAPFLLSEGKHNRNYVRRCMTKKAIEGTGVFNWDFLRALRAADKEVRSAPRVPDRWTVSQETGESIPEFFLSRIADVQVFADVFLNRYEENRRSHLARHGRTASAKTSKGAA